ncbi:MAG TPA: porin [Methylophilus sp.]
MKTKLSLAVASALLAAASSANAGIMIPAGDWTLDIGGVVNAYYTRTTFSGDTGAGTGPLGLGDGNADASANITTGLLPNYLSVSGKTRQNDLDVGFTISINPGASTVAAGRQGSQQENRQAFLTFGDASWGSIKLGKDLGIYASDAILNDMTLLGVGSGAGSLAGNTTTLGRIGSGYMYADWKSQVAYSSPNFNGLSFTVGLTQGWNSDASGDFPKNPQLDALGTGNRAGGETAYEGKVSYEWTGDVAGKVWASAITQKVVDLGPGGVNGDDRATAWDIGTTVNVAGFGLTGYYGQGDGIGQTLQLQGGFDANGNDRESDQWYAQATYVLPGVGTKLGVSYGESTLDGNSVDTFNDIEDSMWTVGAYHPITKHLNLVAEYSQSEREVDFNGGGDAQAKAKTISLGAILFF